MQHTATGSGDGDEGEHDIVTATHCNTLEHTATHCNALQHTATHCNTLQHTATHCTLQQEAAMVMKANMKLYIQLARQMLPRAACTASLHETLVFAATYRNALQRTATHCNKYAIIHSACLANAAARCLRCLSA